MKDKAREFLEDNAYIFDNESDEFVISVSELIALLNGFSDQQNKELIEAKANLEGFKVIKDEKINYLQSQNKELIEFCIWMTGCGYDFTQHKYFIKQRDKLLKTIK